MQYEKTPEELMSEILAGANTDGKTDSQEAISFLEEMSAWLVTFIEIVKNFLTQLGIKF